MFSLAGKRMIIGWKERRLARVLTATQAASTAVLRSTVNTTFSSTVNTAFCSTVNTAFCSNIRIAPCSTFATGDAGGGWIQPATDDQKMMNELQKIRGDTVMVWILALRSKRQLNGDHIRDALMECTRQIPSLQYCFRPNHGQLWLRQMERTSIDFEELSECTNINEEFDRLLHQGFNSESGPLWRARFVPWSPEHQAFVDQFQSDVEVTGDKKSQHLSFLILTFHHGLYDGFSCFLIMESVLIVLNNQFKGKLSSTSPYLKVGSYFDESKRVLEDKKMEQIFADQPQLRENYVDKTKKCFRRPECLDHFPVPNRSEPPKSHTIQCYLNEYTSSKLFQLCKKYGVSPQICMVSAVNAVLVNLMSKAGCSTDTHTMTSTHFINERRYFNNSELDLGLCIGRIRTRTEVPLITPQTFWNHVREFDMKFKSELIQKPSIQERASKIMSEMREFEMKKESAELLYPTLNHFHMSNMMDVTSMLTNNGDEVTVDFLTGANTDHSGHCLFLEAFLTFRGRMLRLFTYNSHLLDDTVAQEIFKGTSQFISDLVEHSE